MALHIAHYETTNLSHLSMGQIELRRRIGAISDLRGNLLAVNLRRHAWRIHHQFLGPPLPRHLRVGAATGLGRFPREGPGLWAATFPKPRARCWHAPGPCGSAYLLGTAWLLVPEPAPSAPACALHQLDQRHKSGAQCGFKCPSWYQSDATAGEFESPQVLDINWWAGAYRTANFSVGGVDIDSMALFYSRWGGLALFVG